MEINLNGRLADVNILQVEETSLKAEVDGKIYNLDFKRIEQGTYSFLLNGRNIEMEVSGTGSKKFEIINEQNRYEAEIVDAEAKYLKNRTQGDLPDDEGTILSPMPGKVVKIMVKEGQEVKKGDTVIIISAMKMESEYKAKKNGVIKKILIEEEATIDGNQTLIIIE